MSEVTIWQRSEALAERGPEASLREWAAHPAPRASHPASRAPHPARRTPRPPLAPRTSPHRPSEPARPSMNICTAIITRIIPISRSIAIRPRCFSRR